MNHIVFNGEFTPEELANAIVFTAMMKSANATVRKKPNGETEITDNGPKPPKPGRFLNEPKGQSHSDTVDPIAKSRIEKEHRIGEERKSAEESAKIFEPGLSDTPVVPQGDIPAFLRRKPEGQKSEGQKLLGHDSSVGRHPTERRVVDGKEYRWSEKQQAWMGRGGAKLGEGAMKPEAKTSGTEKTEKFTEVSNNKIGKLAASLRDEANIAKNELSFVSKLETGKTIQNVRLFGKDYSSITKLENGSIRLVEGNTPRTVSVEALTNERTAFLQRSENLARDVESLGKTLKEISEGKDGNVTKNRFDVRFDKDLVTVIRTEREGFYNLTVQGRTLRNLTMNQLTSEILYRHLGV